MRPYCVGLTGGIGCGKSTVADLFAKLGALVVDTDQISRALTAPGGAAIGAIKDAFGTEFLAGDGGLDRARMRALVFGDAEARCRLEAILHPMIHAEALRQVERAQASYVVLVVPLLLECLSEYRGVLDRIAVVDCEPGQQLARISTRPGLDGGQARAMLEAQRRPADRLAIADDVIDNRSDIPSLGSRVRALHEWYLAEASRKSA